jgi:tRNA modification GTPase
MFSTEDTIAAIATPAGHGGLGVVRLSGPAAAAVAARLLDRSTPLEPRRATFGRVLDGTGTESAGARRAVDQVVATFFPAPGSYTGDDVVEISGHGSPVLLTRILRQALAAGARLAEPGEFTLRAFLNGKLDLVQAEAVADLIEAVTPLQARVAFDQLEGTLTQAIAAIDADLFDLVARLEASLDFPEEGYHFVEAGGAAETSSRLSARIDGWLRDAARGRVIREGRQVAVAGRPNVGKSSLFNFLVGGDRAIVTALPGTTRDLLAERVDLDGLPITLIDTAGVRDVPEEIEAEGVKRARAAMGIADLVVLVLDRSGPLQPDDERLIAATAARPRVIIVNKIDLPHAWLPGEHSALTRPVMEVSLLRGVHVEGIRGVIAQALGGIEPSRDLPAVTNIRHIGLLQRAQDALSRAAESAEAGVAEEFVLAELQDARNALEEITGRRTSEDLLRHIFGRFCIGK